MVIERFGVYLVPLDPAVGTEMRKTRPCVVVSRTEMHKQLHTVTIVPLTSGRTGWPTRVPCVFKGREGEMAMDQIRSVDRRRMTKMLGSLSPATAQLLLQGLKAYFA